ncbi:MAG: hypothetical protein FWF81_06805 [Defluviitaleaceae bacterium]|nr:hypothetical protein [Defluviitaleaceae bacterium]
MSAVNGTNFFDSFVQGSYGTQKGNTQPSTADFHVEQNSTPSQGNPVVFMGISFMGGGRSVSASVSKADGFSASNPVFLVVGTDVDGTPFEKIINVNNIDPRNASLAEMYALNGYRAVNGIPRIPMMLMNPDSPDSLDAPMVANAFEQGNFLSPLLELAATQRTTGNWDSHFILNEVTSWLTQFPRA